MYKVYVKPDDVGRIISVNSDAFLPDTDGRTQIDEGETDHHHHAQGNYLPKSIMTTEGVYRYKLVDGKVIERTAEEIQADIDRLTRLWRHKKPQRSCSGLLHRLM